MAITTTTGLGDKVVKRALFTNIIDGRDWKENGALLSQFNVIKSKNNKPRNILVENEMGNWARITNEMANPLSKDHVLEKFEVKFKRLATETQITQQELEDTGIDHIEHIKGLMEQRLIAGIQLAMLTGANNGSTTTSFQALTTGGNGFKSANTYGGFIEYALIKQVAANVPQGKFWIFNEFPDVKNTNGDDMCTYNNLLEGAHAWLLGKPVYIAQLPMSGTSKQVACVLVDPTAYTIVIGESKIEQLEQGTTQALTGSHSIMGEVYADGFVTNPAGRCAIEFA